eukprot:gene28166-31265_t
MNPTHSEVSDGNETERQQVDSLQRPGHESERVRALVDIATPVDNPGIANTQYTDPQPKQQPATDKEPPPPPGTCSSHPHDLDTSLSPGNQPSVSASPHGAPEDTLDTLYLSSSECLTHRKPLFQSMRTSEVGGRGRGGSAGGGASWRSSMAKLLVLLLAAFTCFMLFRQHRELGQPVPRQGAPPPYSGDDFWRSVVAAARELRDEQQQIRQDTRPLLVLGDLHGDLQQGLRALVLLGAINELHAGSSVLIQVGDIVDRGHHSLPLIDFFEQLKVEAAAVGGEVITLMGNHELMLIQGDNRYVSRVELQRLSRMNRAMKEAESEEPSDTLLSASVMDATQNIDWRPLIKGDPPGTSNYELQTRGQGSSMKGDELMEGMAVWKAFTSPYGHYGQLLRRRPLVHLYNASGCSMLFIHAGLLPSFLDSIDLEIEPSEVQQAASVIRASIGEMLGASGGVWTRLYSDNPAKGCQSVTEVTKRLGVDRIVVGHTIQSSGKIESKCGGRLLMVDVGMSRAIQGKLAVMECQPHTLKEKKTKCKVFAKYRDGSTHKLCGSAV